MQNVVTVGSQSPPVVMTSTKPAAQAAQASGQKSFDLVLKKASANVECEMDNAESSSEFKVRENENKAYSSTGSTVRETKLRKEEKTNNSSIKKNKDDLEESDELDDTMKDDSVETTPGTIVYSQQQNLQQEETLVGLTETIDVENLSVELAENTLNASESEVDFKTAVNPEKILDQFGQVQINNTNVSESENKESNNLFTDINMQNLTSTLNQSENAKQPGVTVLDQTINAETQNADLSLETKNNEAQKVSMQTGSMKGSETDKTSAISALNVEGSTKEFNVKNMQNMESLDQTEKDTAPPDTPLVAKEGIASSAVATSQSNEPARLAEAPRNEVITQVSTQIDQMVKTNRSTLRMQLYPEELGHIDLKIVTTKSGVGVTMIADSASTQEVLRSEMNSLKQNMQQAGIQLSEFNVGHEQTSNSKQQFDEQRNLNSAAYQSTKNSELKTMNSESHVQLQTSVIDYRI